jgi:hypothetical protein
VSGSACLSEEEEMAQGGKSPTIASFYRGKREREREREGQGGSHESATDPSVEPKSVTSGALVSPAPRSLISGPQSGF